MKRISNSLGNGGYKVVLIGRNKGKTEASPNKNYTEKYINTWFTKGKLFYAEFNARLFLLLLFQKMDVICAVDLDTIIPCLLVSKWKGAVRVYDAHELFCEMQEIVTRPFIYKCWKWIEKKTVPQFKYGYTVSSPIVAEFKKMYQRDYRLIRNMPILKERMDVAKKETYILYQGAVNEGRSFETLIPAMKMVNCKLIICGDGNFMDRAKALVHLHGLEEKIIFKGMLPPYELTKYTEKATIGITLFENTGLSNYYSLANRFFDYMHATVPQLCCDYPAYAEINEKFEVALLIDDLEPTTIANALNKLLGNNVLYNNIKLNCEKARMHYNWQEEEKKLLEFYHEILI